MKFFVTLVLIFVLIVWLGYGLVFSSTLNPKETGCLDKHEDVNRSVFEQLPVILEAAKLSLDVYELEKTNFSYNCESSKECDSYRKDNLVALSVIDHEEKVAYFSFKGTSSSEEAGYLISTLTLTSEEEQQYYENAKLVLSKFVAQEKTLFQNEGYELVVTGHSQGTALGAYSAPKLQSMFPQEGQFKLYGFAPATLSDKNHILNKINDLKENNSSLVTYNFFLDGDKIPMLKGFLNIIGLQGISYELPKPSKFSTPLGSHQMKHVYEQLLLLKTEEQLCKYFVRERDLISNK